MSGETLPVHSAWYNYSRYGGHEIDLGIFGIPCQG